MSNNIDRNSIRICILGGGIAGLTCADLLINKYNFPNTTIFEAQTELGGRIKNVNFGKK
jgi:protoporphyrinogen oxidase